MGQIRDLLQAAAGEAALRSGLGRWRQAVSDALDAITGGAATAGGGCCMNGVVLGNAGEEFTVVPLACPQAGTYIVTGVLAGGDLSGGVDWAIVAKTPTTFTVFVSGGIPVDGLLFDFLITPC